MTQNLKEMKHLIEHVAATTTGRLISSDDLRKVNKNVHAPQPGDAGSLENLLTQAEKRIIQKIFNPNGK